MLRSFTIQPFLTNPENGDFRIVAHLNTVTADLAVVQRKAISIARDFAAHGVRIVAVEEEVWRWQGEQADSHSS